MLSTARAIYRDFGLFRGGALLLFIALALSLGLPQTTPPAAGRSAGEVLYILDSDALSRYDASTGQPLGSVLIPGGAADIATGPDGDLYIATLSIEILRYDGLTGDYRATVVRDPIDLPKYSVVRIAFAPDGTLYLLASSASVQQIRRYNAADGKLLGVVLDNLNTAYPAPGVPRLFGVSQIAFGPDGLLYLIDALAHLIVRVDPISGAFRGTVIGPDERIFYGSAFAFGPDGNIYLSEGLLSSLTNIPRQIFRYSPTGQYLGVFAQTLQQPGYLAFGPDGDLYVVTSGGLQRYNGSTGTFIGTIAPKPTDPCCQSNSLAVFSFAGRAQQAVARKPAAITVSQRTRPALQVQRGAIVTTTIVATNRGAGRATNASISVPFDASRLQLLDAQLSRAGAWVSERHTDTLTIQTGALDRGGDVVTATIRLLVRSDAADGLIGGQRLSYRWSDPVDGGAGLSNSLPLRVADQSRDAVTLPLTVEPVSATQGTLYTFRAAYFLPAEPVALWYNTPTGAVIAIGRVAATQAGTIEVQLATAGFARGWYSLVAQGAWSNLTMVGGFEVR